MIKNWYRNLDEEKRLRIAYRWRRFKALFYTFNLNKLAQIHKTDKFGNHNYTPHYHNHFKHLKFKRIKLFEIGVGGYDSPMIGGNSLRMWKSYFPFAKIVSLDIYDKSKLQEKRIKIYKGSQVDTELLDKIHEENGEFDLIIDDGSHINEHVIKSFEYLFPRLKMGGIYVVEDTQTSYWDHYGGSSEDFNQEGTIYSFFKGLIDGLNHMEFMIDGYQPNYYDKHITGMHFYHNMIFIFKGVNDEPSNYLINNKVPNE